MSLKKLNQFVKFDWQAFAKDKVFMVTSCGKWTDYESKEECGTAVEVLIVQDNTPYKTKDGESVSNMYEKLIIKTPQNVSFPAKTKVYPVGVTATVYGDFRNLLSVKAEEIRRMPQQEQTAQK